MTGKKHSIQTKVKMSFSHKGIKCYNWKGGITNVNTQIRNSNQYKNWRKAVFERDNYRCVLCGTSGDGKNLNADHIKPFSIFKDLRFELDNGRTLCTICHKNTDTYAGRLKSKKN